MLWESKNLFWSVKNWGEILDKLKAGDFNATSLSASGFSALYAALLRSLVRDGLIDLIERAFPPEASPYLACSGRGAFLLQRELEGVIDCRVRVCVVRWPFCWAAFLFSLAPGSVGKWLGFLWALIVLPWLQIYSCYVMRGTLWCLFLMISRLMLLMHLTLLPHVWTMFWTLLMFVLAVW